MQAPHAHTTPPHAPRQRPFKQVDVFTATAYLGNPLAVVLDGTGLNDAEMQRFAAWTNLSETTFVLPPTPEAAAAGADYQVRIFTTAYEMPFAGHPTLGTCHAWLQAGGVPRDPARIVQQCKVGLVAIQPQHQRMAFAAPALQRSEPSAALMQALPEALGIAAHHIRAAQHLNNGPHHFGLLLDDAETVLAVQPKLDVLPTLMQREGISGLGVVAPHHNASRLISRSNREARAFAPPAAQGAATQNPDFEVRMFALDLMLVEDPITGSFNASLAQWLIAEGFAPQNYVAAQGTCIDREGRVHIHQDTAGQVWVGGDAITCVDGTVIL